MGLVLPVPAGAASWGGDDIRPGAGGGLGGVLSEDFLLTEADGQFPGTVGMHEVQTSRVSLPAVFLGVTPESPPLSRMTLSATADGADESLGKAVTRRGGSAVAWPGRRPGWVYRRRHSCAGLQCWA